MISIFYLLSNRPPVQTTARFLECSKKKYKRDKFHKKLHKIISSSLILNWNLEHLERIPETHKKRHIFPFLSCFKHNKCYWSHIMMTNANKNWNRFYRIEMMCGLMWLQLFALYRFQFLWFLRIQWWRSILLFNWSRPKKSQNTMKHTNIHQQQKKHEQ